MENPFAEGENRILRPPSTAIVIFGATGDLARRKLLPALYHLYRDGFLPQKFVIIGAARRPIDDSQFVDFVAEGAREFANIDVSSSQWKEFAARLHFESVDGTDQDGFARLRKRLETFNARDNEQYQLLYYLATSPKFFADIAAHLDEANLIYRSSDELNRSVIVVEKPFGDDYESARELNRRLLEHFEERQIFRIDHYLGKETVQNILVFRFANGIFEPLWTREYVDHIQISVSEDIGVGSRAAYFDSSGILKDIIQNHLLQMLSLLCIEPPISLSDPDSIRDEKVKVLRSIRPFSSESVMSDCVRAQYDSGFIKGKSVVGYHEESGVREGSRTETYAALRLEIDNWRWSGVPIYVRAGKRLPKRITELSISFKRAPQSLFRGRQIVELDQNMLAIQVQPREGITLRMNSKPPGPRMRVGSVEMDFSYKGSFGMRSADAYERLLLDAMKGDPTLFTRKDEIEEAWKLLKPVYEGWQTSDYPVYQYAAGTWGPTAADELLERSGHRWRVL
ncbi:MAG: glucose-6-phosphate dehydrogenase [Bdellovibrionales bacterium]|nr:glucose-6-phosphate dehydrogenase [Bdellovibrionales bacterium]